MSIERVFFYFEQMARIMLRAIYSKIKIRVLPTFLGQKMFDIELNTATYVPFDQK